MLLTEYPVDETRFYSTGQSAGSMVSQRFSIAFPRYFAAVAATSAGIAPNANGTVPIEGVTYPAANEVIPHYFVYGQGDLPNIAGTLWDGLENTLDQMVRYHLANSGLTVDDVEANPGVRHGFMDRYETWEWRQPETGVTIYKLTLNHVRSHNTIPEETPSLWDYAQHFSREISATGDVSRYYSPSGFRIPGDRIQIA